MLIFLKLGGSLITDKTNADTPHIQVIERLAGEVRSALDARPDIQLLIGHGSGSFGHFAAKPYGTRQGVRNAEQWQGFARVSAAAARLNRLVTDTFLAAGVPGLSLQPSASALCDDGVLHKLDLSPIQAALAAGLVPLLYGDVALDEKRGGTIVSTEELFLFLAPLLRPERILLVGEVEGVLDSSKRLIPRIRPDEIDVIRKQLGGSHGVDVTGGMLSKVTGMLELVVEHPKVSVQIFSGRSAGLLKSVLLHPETKAGTLLSAV